MGQLDCASHSQLGVHSLAPRVTLSLLHEVGLHLETARHISDARDRYPTHHPLLLGVRDPISVLEREAAAGVQVIVDSSWC